MSYLLAKLFFSSVGRLDRKKAISVGESIGSLFWKLKYRRKVILKNLDIAFPEKDTEWKNRIGKLSLQNIGRTLAEFPKIPQYVKTGEINRIFTIEEGEELLYRAGGKILITAHIGNWEIGGAGLAGKVGNIVSLAYRIKNRKLNQLITDIRNSAGMKIIFHDQPLKDFITALKEQKIIVFLADQNALRHRGVFVEFFGLEASTVFFPAKLAVKYQVPVLFAYQYYDYDEQVYRAVVKEIQIPEGKTEKEKVKALVQRYTTEIEKAVRKHPDQYFWVHKRWKTRPEGQPEDLY
ncbi:lysophospholipid acyltransferase family protein [Persephonella sp.]